jgi:hypothetical protein
MGLPLTKLSGSNLISSRINTIQLLVHSIPDIVVSSRMDAQRNGSINQLNDSFLEIENVFFLKENADKKRMDFVGKPCLFLNII